MGTTDGTLMTIRSTREGVRLMALAAKHLGIAYGVHHGLLRHTIAVDRTDSAKLQAFVAVTNDVADRFGIQL